MGSTCPIIHKRNGIIPLSSWVKEELVSLFCRNLLLDFPKGTKSLVSVSKKQQIFVTNSDNYCRSKRRWRMSFVPSDQIESNPVSTHLVQSITFFNTLRLQPILSSIPLFGEALIFPELGPLGILESEQILLKV